MLRLYEARPRAGLLRAPRALLVLGALDRRPDRRRRRARVFAGRRSRAGRASSSGTRRPRAARAGRGGRRLHEFCLVGWYSMTINANGDAVTCCILQDHKTAVLGNIHAASLAARSGAAPAYERFRARAARDHGAPRRRSGTSAHACAVEASVRAEGRVPEPVVLLGRRPRVPARDSTGWSRSCRGPEGAPFATLPGGSRPASGPPARRRFRVQVARSGVPAPLSGTATSPPAGSSRGRCRARPPGAPGSSRTRPGGSAP